MTILIIKPHPYGKILAKKIYNLGFKTYNLPLIKFKKGKDLILLPKIFNLLNKNDLIFILSQQTIKYVNNFLNKSKLEWPTKPTYYAIGEKTALTLKNNIKTKIFFPKKKENMETLINLPTLKNIKGKIALILKSNNSRNLLKNILKNRGAKTISVECYKQIKKKINKNKEINKLKKYKIKNIIVTNGESLKNLYQLIPKKKHETWLLNCKITVISKRLAIMAYNLGWKTIYITEKASNESLIKSLNIK